jgi:tripartite ATP-independent transporter DctM subunit
MSFALFLLLFVCLMVLGLPIALAMIASSVLYALMNGIDLGFLAIQMYASLNNFILLAIPFFLLASEIMDRTSISDRMFTFARSVVGFIPGGLGHVNVLTNIIFSGMSGSAVADAGGIGRICYKAMVDEGYDESFSKSVTASAAVIGPIIPPSIPMVVYAMVANVSVAKLFFGGVIPGLLLGVALMIYVFVVSKKRGYPVSSHFNLREMLATLFHGALPLLTPLILLGSIYYGIVTVTEAAAVAVLYASALGVFAYRLLTFRKFYDSLKSVFSICGPILLLIIGSKVFGFVLTTEGVSQDLSTSILQVTKNPLMILILINLVFIVAGCLSDPLVNIMIFVPLFLPLVSLSGLNPIHFGVMIVLNCMVGLITPPVGALLVIVNSFGKPDVSALLKEIWPFIIIEFLVLFLVVIVPATVLWIPNLMFR